MRPKRVVLLVGEKESDLNLLSYVLTIRNYAVVAAASLQEVHFLLSKSTCDIMIIQSPMASTTELMKHAKKINPAIPIILLSASKQEPLNVYADAVLYKPSSMELLERIRVMSARKRGPRKGYKKQPESERIEVTANTSV